MKIGQNKHISISYTLMVDGKEVEKVTAGQPLQFVFGVGMLLPSFERNLTGKQAGDKFAFQIGAAEGYGEFIPDAIVELPKNIFEVDGKVEPGLLEVGNQLPMGDNQGNRMIGTIKAVGDDMVTMDFNHPMAGKDLSFEGEVVAVREATEADLMGGQTAAGGCGCGCGEGGDGCSCGEQKAESCDCDAGSSCGCK